MGDILGVCGCFREPWGYLGTFLGEDWGHSGGVLGCFVVLQGYFKSF